MLLGFYVSQNEAAAFTLGVIVGIAALILLGYWAADYEKKRKEREEFEAWKKQRPAEVVDAQFVDINPRPTNSPQLESSKSLVRRTSIERRKV